MRRGTTQEPHFAGVIFEEYYFLLTTVYRFMARCHRAAVDIKAEVTKRLKKAITLGEEERETKEEIKQE